MKFPFFTSQNRSSRARKRSSTPTWKEGNSTDQTNIPHFVKEYMPNFSLKKPIQYFKSVTFWLSQNVLVHPLAKITSLNFYKVLCTMHGS